MFINGYVANADLVPRAHDELADSKRVAMNRADDPTQIRALDAFCRMDIGDSVHCRNWIVR